MKVSFTTLGCKVNQYETQALKEAFSAKGYEIVPEEAFSDIYIVNTCSVTNLSDRKSRQTIRHFRKNNPEGILVVTGCYAQTGTEMLKAMPEVDIIAGTNEKHRILEMVEGLFRSRELFDDEKDLADFRQPMIRVRQREALEEFEDLGIVKSMEGRIRAYIKIQEGCDRFCSYCIIPFARGKVRSREEKEILEEAQAILKMDHREIVLTGINTALYGTDLFDEPQIHVLLEKLEAMDEPFRVRLGSVEPTVINAEYIRKLLQFRKLCHHAHLSVQSGSDKILQAMNRRYNRSDYLEIVRTVNAFDPLYGITTDMIVGFPGETEEDFQESLRLVEEVDFCKVHVFRYSKRNGTKAVELENQIPTAVKNKRSAALIAAAEQSALRFFEKNFGAVRDVLFEEEIWVDGSCFLTGLGDNYVRAYVPVSEENLKKSINSIKKVKFGRPFLDGVEGSLI